jgi:BMFP domain-containing protein YqiC
VVTVELRSFVPGSTRAEVTALRQRVADLEADVAELRRHNLRLAEIVDVVQELLVPMASRDEETVEQAIRRFQDTL